MLLFTLSNKSKCRFKLRNSLRFHLKKQLENKCEICSQIFCTAVELNTHRRRDGCNEIDENRAIHDGATADDTLVTDNKSSQKNTKTDQIQHTMKASFMCQLCNKS